MKNLGTSLTLCLLAVALVLESAHATVIHRYSFTIDASDSAGTANGTNMVNTAQHPMAAAVVYTNGQVGMDGSGGYIQLPGGLVSGLTNLSIEIWATWNGTPGTTGDWQRFFDFGNTDTGGAGAYDIFLTPSYGGSGGKLREGIADADPGYNNERDVSSANTFPMGTETYVVLTYGTNAGVNLYVNGMLDSSGPEIFPLSIVQDVFDYIGRSTYNDPPFNGSFNEFRIHNSILTAPQIAASFSSGPDTVSYDPGTVSALIFTNLQTAMGEGDLQIPRFVATYAKAGAVTIGTADGVTLSSDNTNIVRIKSGNIFGATPGTANITASLGGITTPAVLITVTPAVPVLKHRYSFSDAASSTTIADSVGGSAFAGTLVPDSSGTTNVMLTNGTALFAGASTASYTTAPYIALPGGLFTTMTNLTIEVWATWLGANAGGNRTWQRIFDFGDSSKGASAQNAGNGLDSLYLTVRDGGGNSRWDCFIPAGGGGETVLTGPGALPIGKETHLTAVYAPNRRFAAYYINGIPVATGDAANPLSALSPDGNNWLGASQWNDPPFHGSIDEIRIYEGVLSGVDIALSQATGPDTVPPDPGTLQSVSLSAPALLPGNPFTAQAAFLGTFQHATNINISGVSGVVYTVGNTNVFTINATGGMSAVTNLGTSTLVASFNGLSATTTVSVVGPVAVTISNLPTSAVFDGPTLQATLLATFPGATNVDVSAFGGTTWSVSDPLLASISATGVVTPLSPGQLTVSGTYQGLTAHAQVMLNYATGSVPAVLIHRYSFGDSNVVDSVGGANGQALLDPNKTTPNPVLFTNGLAVLDGSGGYISLPGGLISGLSNVTIEAWVTWVGGADWQNLFMFGNTDANGLGEFGLFGTPTFGGSGGKFRLGFGNADPGFNAEFDVSSPNFFPKGAETHLVVVYAPADGGTRIYVNGKLDVSGAAPDPLKDLQDVLAYLGRSGYSGDPTFNGSFDEFRIYDGAMSGAMVATDFASGPNNRTPRPTLDVKFTNGQLVFDWPLTATGAVLVVSHTLGTGASWASANATVVQTNGVFSATLTPTQSPSFYRLKQ